MVRDRVAAGAARSWKAARVTPTSLQTLDLLTRALVLMDEEGRHHIAARIAMAIDDLTDDRSSPEHTTIN